MSSAHGDERDGLIAQALADLPLPTESPNFFAELRARTQEKLARRGLRKLRALAERRPLVAVATTALIFACVGGLAATFAVPRSHAETNPPVLAFIPALGWNTLQSRDPNDDRIQFVWGANVPFAGKDAANGEPIQTARSLPADGILIYASTLPTVPDPSTSGYKDLQLPLALSNGNFFSGQYENQPSPNVSEYRIDAHVNGRYVYVEVMFGTPNPDRSLLASAQTELSRLFVPRT